MSAVEVSATEAPPGFTPGYAVQLDLRDRPVLVVGGGRVAARKIGGLVESGAAVTVVAPEVTPDIVDLGVTRVLRRRYQRGEVASYRLAVTCSDDPAVNDQVYRDAEAAGVWVNSADDPERCSFILPAVARRGALAISVSTGGRSPALASWLRRSFEADLDGGLGRLLDLLAETRDEVRDRFGTSESEGWAAALDDGLLDLVVAGRDGDAAARLRAHLELPAPAEAAPTDGEAS
jgi:siroheme synthase-like protein